MEVKRAGRRSMWVHLNQLKWFKYHRAWAHRESLTWSDGESKTCRATTLTWQTHSYQRSQDLGYGNT